MFLFWFAIGFFQLKKNLPEGREELKNQ